MPRLSDASPLANAEARLSQPPVEDYLSTDPNWGAPPAPGSLMDPARKPAVTEDFLPPSKSVLDHLGSAAKNFGKALDPRPAIELLDHVAKASPLNPAGDHGAALVKDLKAMGGAQVDLAKKAVDAGKRGRVSEAIGYGASAAVPLVGPAMAAAGEQIGSGDVSGGAGSVLGLLAGVAGPNVVAKALPKRIGVPPVVGRTKNPVTAEAVAFGEKTGIPIDAATASGKPIVQTIQKRVEDSIGGGPTAHRFRERQQAGLATVGEQLAAKSNRGGSSVTPEQAGARAQEALQEVVHDWNVEASTAYEKLRAMEADPKHTSVIEPPARVVDPEAPALFTMQVRPTTDQVFLAALQDARKQGYTGSAAELKGVFDDKVKSARELKASIADVGDEYGHAELLKSIRDLGGIRSYDKGFVQGAPPIKMRGEYDAVKQLFPGRGAASIFRENGVPLDDMVAQLRQDPRWQYVLTEDADLLELLHEIGRAPVGEGAGIQHYLDGVGVKPGVKWWESEPKAQSVPMAVDLRPVKASLKETYDGLMLEGRVAPLVGAKATAARALERLMTAPDYVPLSAADAALGELKSFIRSKNPDLRSVGQGKAVGAVNELHAAVQRAAEAAGPEAVKALEEGRQATTAKYIAAEVLEGIAGPKGDLEPVRAFDRLTAPRDAAIQQLRDVAKQAPETMPQIGRAVLDGLMDTAKADGGFTKAATVEASWRRLGDETKKVLYRDPDYIRDVDNLFRLATKAGENVNPSGTARVSGMNLTQLAMSPVMWAASKLLYTRRGVKLLTEGLTIPLRSPAQKAAYVSRLNAAIEAAGGRLEPVTADDSREPKPATTVRR